MRKNRTHVKAKHPKKPYARHAEPYARFSLTVRTLRLSAPQLVEIPKETPD